MKRFNEVGERIGEKGGDGANHVNECVKYGNL